MDEVPHPRGVRMIFSTKLKGMITSNTDEEQHHHKKWAKEGATQRPSSNRLSVHPSAIVRVITLTSTAVPDLKDLRYRALQMIITSVSNSLLSLVLNCIDTRFSWLKLQELYESKSMNRRLTLKGELYSLKMNEKTSIDEHLKAISMLVGQLANIDIAILDEELVNRVLTSWLPS
jgi:hypothetical protein